jgi:hypothetical protein
VTSFALLLVRAIDALLDLPSDFLLPLAEPARLLLKEAAEFGREYGLGEELTEVGFGRDRAADCDRLMGLCGASREVPARPQSVAGPSSLGRKYMVATISLGKGGKISPTAGRVDV